MARRRTEDERRRTAKVPLQLSGLSRAPLTQPGGKLGGAPSLRPRGFLISQQVKKEGRKEEEMNNKIALLKERRLIYGDGATFVRECSKEGRIRQL